MFCLHEKLPPNMVIIGKVRLYLFFISSEVLYLLHGSNSVTSRLSSLRLYFSSLHVCSPLFESSTLSQRTMRVRRLRLLTHSSGLRKMMMWGEHRYVRARSLGNDFNIILLSSSSKSSYFVRSHPPTTIFIFTTHSLAI